MFTGIIEEMGVLKEINRGDRSSTGTILAKQVLEDLSVGDSITVNGVCLSATFKNNQEFKVDISFETLNVSNLDSLKPGDAVNLERALRVGQRMGGHWVTGHIDGMGIIRQRNQEENALFLSIEAPPHVLRYCIKKGSITVDGISLTINEISSKEFQVAIIPHTARITVLGLKGIGATVNLESDLIGKYIERLLNDGESSSRITTEYLRRKEML